MKKTILSLKEAQRAIDESLVPNGAELVELHDALGRVAASPQYALHALPSYSQALYDGVVIARMPKKRKGKRYSYSLEGEIAAGDIISRKCLSGQAYRIMTGAPIPEGGYSLVPQEKITISENRVFVDEEDAKTAGAYIRKKGGDCRIGTRIVKAGDCLTPADIGMLADTGYDDIQVRKKPVVAYCCTGSELVGHSADSGNGLKVSSNRYRLGGMIRICGGDVQDWGSVDDNRRSFEGRLARMQKQEPECIITTGGMGPGKYDLVQEVFSTMGGRVVFTGVELRPGKSVLFGVLGSSLFFGLPGPPSAVKAVFQVLVRPMLQRMLGIETPVQTRAVLTHDFSSRNSNMPRLLEGVLSHRAKGILVRLARKNERTNCYILCPPGKWQMRKGASVTIYSEEPPRWLAQGNYQIF
ncbi:MAG: hypothetical protein CSA26_10995 [Desulfobacterales bacterium]|nr:MAG: hypothetical protein CSA26_10995 [Desulfobacterales bacterium]